MINGIKNLFGDTCRNIIKNTLFLLVSPNIKFIPYASKNDSTVILINGVLYVTFMSVKYTMQNMGVTDVQSTTLQRMVYGT